MINFSFLGYAIAVSVTLLFSWLVYKLFFESKIKPSINRTVLLMIYGLSLIVPVISSVIRLPMSKGVINIGHLSLASSLYGNSPNNMVIEKGIKIMGLINYIYFSGIALMLLVTAISIFKLYRLKRNSTKLTINGHEVFIHNCRDLASFSWINNIFLYENSFSHDASLLLAHEGAHIRMKHWVDLCVSQLFIIFQWFNPVVWIMKKEMQQIHEYQADAEVINRGYDEKTYQSLLLRNITNVKYPSIVDGFNNCSIKKRLLMMKKSNFKSNSLLRLFVLVFSLVIGGAILYIPAVARIIEVPPTFNETKPKIEKPDNIGITKAPEYEGGEKALNMHLARRLRYPYDAYQKEIQGTVVVQFTVKANGSLADFRIENSVNPELDVAAVNAIKDLPGRWTPGKIDGNISDISYTLPITFKLQ